MKSLLLEEEKILETIRKLPKNPFTILDFMDALEVVPH